jgi:DNA-binding PadR family transcriptional regulator
MALAQAILSSLAALGPCSGYDLVKRFDEFISCYWMASHQQVYRELRELERKGWVSSEAVIQTGRPNKVIYSITETGKQQLIDWALQPSEPTPIREPLMIKLKAGGLVPLEVILQEIKRRQQLHSSNLERLRQIETEDFSELTSQVACKLHYLSLRRGIRYESEWVEWCEEAIQAVQEMIESEQIESEQIDSAENE